MYHKQSTGVILVLNSLEISDWIRWVHRSLSENHCDECLKLDGCLFSEDNHPTWPHHPACHCILKPISYTDVLANAVADSAYSKYDPYLFNTTGAYSHGKEKLFEIWGYSAKIFPG